MSNYSVAKKCTFIILLGVLISLVIVFSLMIISWNSNEINEDISSVTEDNYDREYLKYINRKKKDVLEELVSYEHYGEFEGADYYQTDTMALGFSYENNCCVCVDSDFETLFPDLAGESDEYVTKDAFDSYIDTVSEIYASDDTDMEVPHLYAYTKYPGEKNKMCVILVKCDEDGNIKTSAWCRIILKNKSDIVRD